MTSLEAAKRRDLLKELNNWINILQERSFIDNIVRCFSTQSQLLHQGIGDDCAVFGNDKKHKWLISTDLLVENIHFVIDWHDPCLLGRKCIAVNLSDIAAMGGTPKFVLISVAVPDHIDDRWLQLWQSGVQTILQEHECDLIGGDTTRGEHFTVNVTILGICETENICYRSGAANGDDIYVTGELGKSAGGLAVLKQGEKDSLQFQDLLDAHLNPVPQVQTGKDLAESRVISSMQDISDGLSTDLSHICRQSGVGALLRQEKLPVSQSLKNLCGKYDMDPFDLILNGGEDYQLVFTASRNSRKCIREIADKNNLTFSRVGSIRSGEGVYLITTDGRMKSITYSGYEHKSQLA